MVELAAPNCRQALRLIRALAAANVNVIAKIIISRDILLHSLSSRSIIMVNKHV